MGPCGALPHHTFKTYGRMAFSPGPRSAKSAKRPNGHHFASIGPPIWNSSYHTDENLLTQASPYLENMYVLRVLRGLGQ